MLVGVSLAQAESPGAPQYILNEITKGLLPVLQNHPKATLLGIELGNEINLYYTNPAYRPSTYSVANQVTDLSSYVTVLKNNSTTKSLTLTVPAYYDPSVNSIEQGVDVIVADLTKCAKCSTSNVGLVTLHEYPLSLYKGQVPTIAQLLSNSIDVNTEQVFTQAVSDAQTKFGLSVQLDESGSVSVDPGQPGVSNVQAAVLWELDFARWQLLHSDPGQFNRERLSGGGHAHILFALWVRCGQGSAISPRDDHHLREYPRLRPFNVRHVRDNGLFDQ
jgi:hypothetical protein